MVGQHSVPFGAATFVFYQESSQPTRIEFRYPSLHLALLERGQRLSGPEWRRAGIYFLIGPGESTGSYRIYVGKSPSGVATRIAQHEATKDWWDRAVVVVADRRDGFTSAEVAWLEAEFVNRLRANVGEAVDNKNQPIENTLPSYMLPELEAQVQPIEAVLRLLGVLTVASEPEVLSDESDEQVATERPPVQQHTWLEAALLILPEDGSPLHVNEIVRRVIDRGLRDAANAKTPDATLRRDLRVNSVSDLPLVRQTAPSTFARVLPTVPVSLHSS